MKTSSRKVLMIGLCAALLMAVGGHPMPATADDGYKIISSSELIDWLASNDKPVLVFALSRVEYNEERISGSICIPVELMKGSDLMPRDRGTPIVFYCHGPG
jgi:hypothetical protein